MNKKIITAPNVILRTKSKDISLNRDRRLLNKYTQDLQDTLLPKDGAIGVGLALPQIGKNGRIFSTFLPESSNSIDTDYPSDAESKKSLLRHFYNPSMIDRSDLLTFGPNSKEPILEGCLSIPGFYGPVPRHEWVTLAFQTEEGTRRTETFKGFFARVIQHEFDHLEGILFTDYILKEGLPLYQRNAKNQLDEIHPELAKNW